MHFPPEWPFTRPPSAPTIHCKSCSTAPLWNCHEHISSFSAWLVPWLFTRAPSRSL